MNEDHTNMNDISTPRGDNVEPKHFHIFGYGISFSISPTIHSAAFRHYGLPHTYDIKESTDLDEVAPLIHDSSFGGSSVTMPHKIHVQRFCSSQTGHATKIGAVNTLIVKQPGETSEPTAKRTIVGDNTDWSGLFAIIQDYIKTNNTKPPRTGLVVGAGGASRAALYALRQAGLSRILLWNRTVANAEKIAQDYQHLFHVEVLTSLETSPEDSPDIILGTVPADKTTEAAFVKLFAKDRGLCIDMSYKPRLTPLLIVAQRRGEGWKTVPGVTVLLHQAYDQFELWTGLPAPRKVMVDALEAHEVEVARL